MSLLVAERAHETGHVACEHAGTIVRDARRLCRVVVSTEVRRDDFEARGQSRDLMSPAVPELRKAVQQQHQRPVARRHAVEANAIRLDELVLPTIVHPWTSRIRRACEPVVPASDGMRTLSNAW
jgi:hypothetical protein